MALDQDVRSRVPSRIRTSRNMDLPKTPAPQRVPSSKIPVFINNYNRLGSMTELIEWLLEQGTERIEILDNSSTYPPLLKWYEQLPRDGVKVSLHPNLGPWAFWSRSMHKEQSTPYIVTDADIVPSECCPVDLVNKMQDLLLSNPECGKVGPGLRLDNIPDLSRDFITNGDGKGWEGEGVFWKRRHSPCTFYAPIDTTFAMYNAFSPWVQAEWNNLRMDAPYLVEHTPWYTHKPFSAEEQYYRDTASKTWSHVTWPSPINS